MSTTNSPSDAYAGGNTHKLDIFKRCKVISCSDSVSFVIFDEIYFVKVLEAITDFSVAPDRSVMPTQDRIEAMEHEIAMMEKAGEDCAFQPLGRVMLDGATVGYLANLGVCNPKTLPPYFFEKETLLGGPTFAYPTQKLIEDLTPLVHRLHDRGVLHGHIKPSNILYDKHQHRFLFCDFGSARLQSSQEGMGGSTDQYVTPARARFGGWKTPLLKEDDLYATGITIWELASSKDFPFYDIDRNYIEDVVSAGFQPNLYEVNDLTTRRLIRSLLDQGFPQNSGFKPYSTCVKATVVYSNCLVETAHTYNKVVHSEKCEGDDKCGDVYQAPSPLGHVEQLPCRVCSS